MMESTPEQNKATVLEAFDTLFNKRDYAAAERFWSDRYIQHSAHIAPGRGGLFALGRALPATLRHRPSRPVPRPPVRAAPGLARLAGRPARCACTKEIRSHDCPISRRLYRGAAVRLRAAPHGHGADHNL